MKRIVSTLLALILALSLVPTMAFAADKVTFGAKASKSSLTIGDEVEVTVSVNAIKASRGVAIYLNYDKSKVEYVSAAPQTSTTLGKDADYDHLSAKSQVGFVAELKNATDVKASDLIKVKFKAIAEGEATFTLSGGEAYYGEGSSLAEYEVDQSATAKVSISKPVIKVTSVTVFPKTLSLEVGLTGTLTATVTPDNATDKTVTWTSSNDKVATVAADGTVTPVGEGTATITATAANGKKDTCTVKVTKPAHKHNANGAVMGQASTCVEQGWESYYKCTECGAVVDVNGVPTEIKYLPLAAHKLTKHDAVPATCTTDGTEAYWTCEVCKQMFSDENGTKKITKIPTVSALGHKFDESVPPTEVVAPSADKVGLYSRTCKNCNHTVYAAELVMIPKDTVNVVVKQSDKSKKDFSKPVTFSIKASGSDGILKFTIDPVTDDIVAAAKTDAGYAFTESQFTGAYAWGMERYFDTPEAAYIALNKYLEDGITFTQTISANEKTWAADAKSHTMKVVINRNGTFNVDESTITFTNTFTYSKKAGGGSTTTTDDTTKTDGKKVESGKTFDAGIAMYVGLSVLSVTGGALVIGKKKHF